MAWTYKQTWSNSTNYNINDVVLWNYTYYRALTANINNVPPSNSWLTLEPVDALIYIISTGLNIDQSRVFLYNQDFNLPTDTSLFVVLQLTNAVNISSTNQVSQDINISTENLTDLFVEYYEISLMSRDNSARLRRADILRALSSTLSLYWQEVFQIKISRNARQFTNLSALEGGSMLTRFSTDIAVNTWYAQTNNIDYYDEFPNTLTIN